jgi:hypothetical protein
LNTQTLYDYEVAVYAELNNGSNAWNGSVLAVMLLAGTVGALLPTWLKHDVDTEHKEGTNHASVQEANMAINSDVPTGALDSTSLLSDNSNTADTEQQSGVYKATSEFVVGMRITLAGALSCVSLLLFVLSWQVVASVSFLALFFATWQYINVVCFARLALALKLAQLGQRDIHTRDNEEGGSSENNKLRRSSTAFIARTIVPMDRTVSSDHEGRHNTTTSTDVSDTQAHLEHSMNPVITSQGAKTRNSAGSEPEQQIGSEEDIPEPPYSVALVSVIALNVVVQIILQAVTFSGLELPLRASCWVFVLTLCAATAAYVLCLLCYFGQAVVGCGLRSLFVRGWVW